MKYMTGKAKMMVTGIALGTVAAGGMAALIAAGKVGVIGSLVVVFLIENKEENDYHVRLDKDLWFLDGSQNLNGKRILDAERREEELT